MENGRKVSGITITDLAVLALLSAAGLAAIRWLVHHPEKARQIDMAILLGTKKSCYAIADGFQRGAVFCRKVADNASTAYQEMRIGE